MEKKNCFEINLPRLTIQWSPLPLDYGVYQVGNVQHVDAFFPFSSKRNSKLRCYLPWLLLWLSAACSNLAVWNYHLASSHSTKLSLSEFYSSLSSFWQAWASRWSDQRHAATARGEESGEHQSRDTAAADERSPCRVWECFSRRPQQEFESKILHIKFWRASSMLQLCMMKKLSETKGRGVLLAGLRWSFIWARQVQEDALGRPCQVLSRTFYKRYAPCRGPSWKNVKWWKRKGRKPKTERNASIKVSELSFELEESGNLLVKALQNMDTLEKSLALKEGTPDALDNNRTALRYRQTKNAAKRKIDLPSQATKTPISSWKQWYHAWLAGQARQKNATAHAGRVVPIRRGLLPFSRRNRWSGVQKSWTSASLV